MQTNMCDRVEALDNRRNADIALRENTYSIEQQLRHQKSTVQGNINEQRIKQRASYYAGEPGN